MMSLKHLILLGVMRFLCFRSPVQPSEPSGNDLPLNDAFWQIYWQIRALQFAFGFPRIPTNVIHRHYKGLVKEADATEFWRITPATVTGDIVNFPVKAAA